MDYRGYYKGDNAELIVISHNDRKVKMYIVGADNTMSVPTHKFNTWCKMYNMVKFMDLQKPKQFKKQLWQLNQKSILADRLNISRQYLSDIIGRRVRAPYPLAVQIESTLKSMGVKTHAIDWMASKETLSPLFKLKY